MASALSAVNTSSFVSDGFTGAACSGTVSSTGCGTVDPYMAVQQQTIATKE